MAMSGTKVVELEGIVEELEKSKLPNVYIAHIKCSDGSKITLDIHKKVMIFDRGDRLKITIATHMPKYEEGRDFLARGYVFNKKTSDSVKKLLISLWGFLVVIETQNEEIYNKFDYMDEVYFHIKNLGHT